MKDIIKIVRSHKESGFLLKGISKIIKNEAKNKNVDFLQCY